MAVVFLIGLSGRMLYTLALVWLAFLRAVFQGVGMALSGMATDPKKPLLLVLMLLPIWSVNMCQSTNRIDIGGKPTS